MFICKWISALRKLQTVSYSCLSWVLYILNALIKWVIIKWLNVLRYGCFSFGDMLRWLLVVKLPRTSKHCQVDKINPCKPGVAAGDYVSAHAQEPEACENGHDTLSYIP